MPTPPAKIIGANHAPRSAHPSTPPSRSPWAAAPRSTRRALARLTWGWRNCTAPPKGSPASSLKCAKSLSVQRIFLPLIVKLRKRHSRIDASLSLAGLTLSLRVCSRHRVILFITRCAACSLLTRMIMSSAWRAKRWPRRCNSRSSWSSRILARPFHSLAITDSGRCALYASRRPCTPANCKRPTGCVDSPQRSHTWQPTSHSTKRY